MTLVVFGEDSIVFFPIISVLGVAEDGIRSAGRPSVKRERGRESTVSMRQMYTDIRSEETCTGR